MLIAAMTAAGTLAACNCPAPTGTTPTQAPAALAGASAVATAHAVATTPSARPSLAPSAANSAAAATGSTAPAATAAPSAATASASATATPAASAAALPHGRFKPVGPCVDTKLHAAKQLAKTHNTPPQDWFDFVVVLRRLDLDGDGKEDEIRNGGAASMTVRHFLYVMRGRCGHFVGEITEDVSLGFKPGSHLGLFDVGGLTGCPVHCCEHATDRTWRFDGRAYQLAEQEELTQKCDELW